MYAPDAPYTVYCPKCWWSDKWDARDYGRDYDFSRPFFGQFNELFHEVPLLGLSLDLEATKTAPYNNHAGNLKRCYLLFNADYDEECAYGFDVSNSRAVVDCSIVDVSELCYDSSHGSKNNRCVGSSHTNNSLSSAFLRDSDNCRDCFASANLRNAAYHIFNKPYVKKQYDEELKKWDLGSYRAYTEVKAKAAAHWKQYPPKPYWHDFSIDVTGNYVFESKNCKECYEVAHAQDCKYLLLINGPAIRDCYDVSCWGDNISLGYECGVIGGGTASTRFCHEAGLELNDAEYSTISFDGANHFGCVSMRGKYCILNKCYTKEEYEALRARIVAHMDTKPYVDKRGRVYRYGEFFPTELSAFAYNETMAQYFFPLSRQQAESRGFRWKEKEKQKYAITVKAEDLPDHITDTPGSILKEVIGCMECGRGFRVIQMELAFLREMNLPLPRRCPFCRIDEKMRLWVKNLGLVERICMTCHARFRTPYTEAEVPHLLCEACFRASVL